MEEMANMFFRRKIKAGKRVFDTEPEHLCAPCDGLLSVWNIQKDKKEINYKLIEIDNLKKENVSKTIKIEQLENQIRIKEDQIKSKEDKIKSLEGELCYIKNSKSWKYTEPIRKAKKFLKGDMKQK